MLEQHELNAQQQVLRSTVSSWVMPAENASQAFALSYGSAGTGYSDQFSNFNVPQRSQAITQDGVTFRNEVTSFDAFVSPVSVTKSSSLGFSRSETTSYADHAALWVLDHVATVTDGATGKKLSETSYDARATDHIQVVWLVAAIPELQRRWHGCHRWRWQRPHHPWTAGCGVFRNRSRLPT